MKSTRCKVQFSVLLATIFLSTVSFIALPDTVAVQWDGAAATNYMAKPLAVLIPVAVCILFIILWNGIIASRGTSKAAACSYWAVTRITGIIAFLCAVGSFLGIFGNILLLMLN